MKTVPIMVGSCLALTACRHPPSRSAPADVQHASARPATSRALPTPSAVQAAKPPRDAPTPFHFFARVPDGADAKLFRLPSGIALSETRAHGWKLSVAHSGDSKLSPVTALGSLPDARKPMDVLFAGEARQTLWISLLDTQGMPRLRMLTFRVTGHSVQRTHGWLRAIGAVGKGVVGLRSTTNPAYLDDHDPQHFEQLEGARAKLPSIPADKRLYDVEILPSGAIHALASLPGADAAQSIVAWIAEPGTPPRTLPLPRQVGQWQPTLVRGSQRFLASAHDDELIGEQGGRLVLVHVPSFTAAAASADGSVWFATSSRKGPPGLYRARVDFHSSAPVGGTPVPLPSHAVLGAGGGKACGELGSIENIAPLPDGEVWLLATCSKHGEVVLRGHVRG